MWFLNWLILNHFWINSSWTNSDLTSKSLLNSGLNKNENYLTFTPFFNWHLKNSVHMHIIVLINQDSKNLGQYDRPRIPGCKPVDGVLVVLSSNQLNIAMFFTRWEKCVSHLVNKRGNIYLIWAKINQYPIYWFASKYSRSVILAQVLWNESVYTTPAIAIHNKPVTDTFLSCLCLGRVVPVWMWPF